MTLVSILPRAFPIIWGAWGSFWLLSAAWSAPNAERQPATARLLHLSLTLVGGGFFFASTSRDSFLGTPVIPVSKALAVAGLLATLAGLLFTVWARFTLGRMWSGRVTLKEDHVIVDRGPYALARHPIYTGLLFALLGNTLALGSVAAFLGFALIALGLIAKLRQEERLLLGHFGPAYEEYRGRVKGLIPLVW